MKAVVMDLLRQYLKVEIQFQNGENCSGLCISSILMLTLKGVFFIYNFSFCPHGGAHSTLMLH